MQPSQATIISVRRHGIAEPGFAIGIEAENGSLDYLIDEHSAILLAYGLLNFLPPDVSREICNAHHCYNWSDNNHNGSLTAPP